MADLTENLAQVFPFARRIEVSVPLQADGSYLAELVLPVKHGESVVQVYRHPANTVDPLPHEDKLRWHGPYQRSSFGHGRWEFLAAWDAVASMAEIRELVQKRVTPHPVLGDSHQAPAVRYVGPRAAKDLLRALTQLLDAPGFETDTLDALLADVRDGWLLSGHQVHPGTETCVFHHSESGLWAMLLLPIPIRGGRPSTRPPGARDEPIPIPFDVLPGDRRRQLFRETLGDLPAGSVSELADLYLPDPDYIDPDDPDDRLGLRRIRTGALHALVTLLDSAPAAESAPVETMLELRGLLPQVTAYRETRPDAP